VLEIGPCKWTDIAAQIPGRNGKSCRLRWCNQLDPGVNRNPFTEWEDAFIIRAQDLHGNKWARKCCWGPEPTDMLLACLMATRHTVSASALCPFITFHGLTGLNVLPTVVIANLLGGEPKRTDNAIKNRWNSTLMKQLQHIRMTNRFLSMCDTEGRPLTLQDLQELRPDADMPTILPKVLGGPGRRLPWEGMGAPLHASQACSAHPTHCSLHIPCVSRRGL
jgi:hypothetical protein